MTWRFWLGAILVAWAAIFIAGRVSRQPVQPQTVANAVQYNGFAPQTPRGTVPESQPSPRQHIALGDSGTIDNGTPIVMLSTTKDGYDDINNALAARDTIGLRNLILAGKAFTVRRGTNGKVIDTSFTLRRVRILDGDKADAAGWLPFEWLK